MSKLSMCPNERLPQEKASQEYKSLPTDIDMSLCWFNLMSNHHKCSFTGLRPANEISAIRRRRRDASAISICRFALGLRSVNLDDSENLMKWTVHSLLTLTKPCQLAFACATHFSLHLILLCRRRASQSSRSAVWDSRGAASTDELTTILWSAWLSIARAC